MESIEVVQTAIEKPPIPRGVTRFFRILGWALIVISAVAGSLILLNAPKESAEADAQLGLPLRTVYLMFGWAQLIGGISTGLVLNVIAAIGDALLEVWKTQRRRS